MKVPYCQLTISARSREIGDDDAREQDDKREDDEQGGCIGSALVWRRFERLHYRLGMIAKLRS
jgi:hypothetical protein